MVHVESTSPFNCAASFQVPRNKQRFGSRAWGMLTAPHAVDTRTCSVYTQETGYRYEVCWDEKIDGFLGFLEWRLSLILKMIENYS